MPDHRAKILSVQELENLFLEKAPDLSGKVTYHRPNVRMFNTFDRIFRLVQ